MSTVRAARDGRKSESQSYTGEQPFLFIFTPLHSHVLILLQQIVRFPCCRPNIDTCLCFVLLLFSVNLSPSSPADGAAFSSLDSALQKNLCLITRVQKPISVGPLTAKLKRV